MSFLESVIQRTKKLERLLEEKYQAVGKGLHEKATSVEHTLDPNTLKQIRFIASIRNKLIHEDGYRFDGNENEFLRKCDEVIEHLTNQQTRTKTYITPQYVPKPVETTPRHKPEPIQGTPQASTTNSYKNGYSAASSSSYSSSRSPSWSYSGSTSKSSVSTHSSTSNIGKVFKNTLQAVLIGIFLYPVIGLGGCITRIVAQGPPPDPMRQTQAHNIWLNSPVKSWTTEALIIPLLIVAITYFASLVKTYRAEPVPTIILFLFGIVVAIFIGSRFTSLIRRDTSSAPVVNNSGQTGTVGTMREVNTVKLNMRSGPGSNYPVVATFPKKSRIVSYGETRNVNGELWTQASTPDGQTRGWVNRKFLSP
jgi:hypothetical protein